MVTMLSGPFFLHIYPGHLATIDSLAWTPLILLAIDELIEQPAAKWVLVGIFAFSMQLLAGHPQTFFNTLVTCAAYGSMRLWWHGSYRGQTILAVAIVGLAALAITAAQVWTGMEASGESTRAGGVSFAFAAMFSFPPENFLTALVPGLLGNMTDFTYWGRCYLWEMSAFVGLTGLTMAIFGATVKFPGRTICLVMVALLVILALGNHTPLFPLLYRFAPGFDHFRSHSKFLAQVLPFIAILIGQGTNRVLASSHRTKGGAMLVGVAALIVGAIGLCLLHSQDFAPVREGWESLMANVAATGESYLRAENFTAPEFNSGAASFAGSQCIVSAIVLLAIAMLLYARGLHASAAYGLIILGIGEMIWFANSSIVSFSLADTVPSMVSEFLAARPGDYRILELPFEFNGAIAIGANDIWGYDPMVLSRYAQFMTYSQGGNPDDADMYVTFRQKSNLFRLLRLKYLFRKQIPTGEINGALPHLLLVGEWARQNNRDDILRALDSSLFDPERTVILETDPDPAPVSGEDSPGTVQLVRSDTDSLTISARLSRPALLLVTDCYSRYWRAVAEAGSAQHYTVIPADYTLMAVPLSAGEHLFRLEYAPPGYVIGRWISLLGLALYLIVVAFSLKGIRLPRTSGPQDDNIGERSSDGKSDRAGTDLNH
jgi:hypothetical protein